jgi:hypothetical protein
MTWETDVPCVPCYYDPPTLEKKSNSPFIIINAFFIFQLKNKRCSSSNQTWQWKTNHLVPWMSQKNQGISQPATFGDTANYVH